VEAMRNAQGYVTKKGYPSNTLVTRVVDGGEPTEFKALFTSWKERNQILGMGKQTTGKLFKQLFVPGLRNICPWAKWCLIEWKITKM
jgi:hypothetical protein